MSDDLDDLLRRTMKTLDDEVPSGYFEGLPKRTLARLEDSSMQTTGNRSERDPSGPMVAPMSSEQDRDEDSGLHDIRNLASSTKARLSSRRSTQSPVVNEDDVLASSSAGWKAVALPEPAKMVSLPELASLPSNAVIEAQDKAARKAAKAEAKAEAKVEAKIAKATPAAIPDAAPAFEAPAIPTIGSRIAAQNSGGKGKTIALVGVGLAAAAGAVFFFAFNKNDKSAGMTYEKKESAPLPTMTAKQLPAPEAAPAVVADTAAAAEPTPPPPPVEIAAAVEEKPAAKGEAKKEKVHKVEIRDTVNKDKPADKPPVVIKEDKPKTTEGEGEPSFDALLKEAGVSDQKKVTGPKLDKKSLSGGDIKAGMGSIASKAQACYAGTQGTAAVKLTVAPSGQVQKVTVTGVFAGTPVAACVEKAVKSATFPPWDGGPQSFGYSYLLSE